MDYLSTTGLAKEMDVPANELFAKLKGMGWIDRHGDKWVLTELGRKKGGQTRTDPKFGEFIVWPEDINLNGSNGAAKNLNATALGKHFDISSQRMDLILAELGWLEKDASGWIVTKAGRALGGRQMEHDPGSLYAVWPAPMRASLKAMARRQPNGSCASSTWPWPSGASG